jgi:hypothetical protein
MRRGRYSNVILEGVLLVARLVPAYGIPIVTWTHFSVRAVRISAVIIIVVEGLKQTFQSFRTIGQVSVTQS